MHAFDREYWPVHIATAWVATRDRNFIDQIPWDKSMRYLAVALAKYVVVDNRGLRSATLPRGSHDAFLALRDAAATGRSEAVGDPYHWAVGQSGIPTKVFEQTRVIDPLEILSAVCRDDRGTLDCLVPKNPQTHVSRFQNIFFRRSSVLARFPALPATLATARNEDKAAEALSTYVADRTTRLDAQAWLRGRGYNVGERAFRRVWRKAREIAGLTPSAPSGRKQRS